MEQQGCFDSLPTEALFSLFRSLDPLLLGPFSTVCKKWNHLSKDNELWRQYCLERWDKNPKESDCVKNWLIPVREGGGTKENRIDWRRCYLLRSLFDRATKFMQLVPEKKQRLGFLKRKNAKSSTDSNDLFDKGWPSAEDIAKFEKRIESALEAFVGLVEDAGENGLASGFDNPDYMALVDLFFELELLILRQINISRVKYLGSAGRFLHYITPVFISYPEEVPLKLTEFAETYTKLAVQKDIPTEVLVELLKKIAISIVDLIGHAELHQEFYDYDLPAFTALIIECMVPKLQSALPNWASEDGLTKRSESLAFEEILHRISGALHNLPYLGMPMFIAAITRTIKPSADDKLLIVPKFAVLAAVAKGCAKYIADFTLMFMKNFILPFWKYSDDPEYLVPILIYFSTILVDTGGADIQLEFVDSIIPPVLEMAKHENANVKREVACFIASFCAHLENPETLTPYLADLLEILYTQIKHNNSAIRHESLIALTSLIITCNTSFSMQKDRMMTEFKKLLATGNDFDRKSVIEALTRVGAGVGEQRSAIEADVAVLYDQVVEDCKQDRDAHLDLLLKMTEFAIVVLGPKFSKHMSFVFPLIVQNATIPEILLNETSEQVDTEDIKGSDQSDVSMQAISRNQSSLSALHNMISILDRETFLAVHLDIATTLRQAITRTEMNTAETILKALSALPDYVRKLFAKDDPTWCSSQVMMSYWINIANMLLNTLEELDGSDDKSEFVSTLRQIFKHLCDVSTLKQPFLNFVVMQHLTEDTFSRLLDQYYRAEAEGIPFERIMGLGTQIVDFMKVVCATRIDKESFWHFADPILELSVEEFSRINQYRWFDVSLVNAVFEYFGNEFLEMKRMKYLAKSIVPCMVDIRTDSVCLVVANHFGITARKYEEMLPKPDSIETMDVAILPYLTSLLTEDQREAAPSVYNSALAATSALLLYVGRSYEKCTTNRKKVHEILIAKMNLLTSAMPPTAKGEKDNGVLAIRQFCQILKTTQVYFEGEEGALLKTDVIRALQKTLEMPEYSTQEVRDIVDPILEKLQPE